MYGIATLLSELANGADRPSLCRASPTLDRSDPIGGRQRHFGRLDLIGKEPSLRGPRAHTLGACDVLRTALALAQPVEIFAFESEHFGRGVAAPRRADFGIDSDQSAGAFPRIRRAPDLLKIGSAHRMLERHSLQCATVDYGRTFAPFGPQALFIATVLGAPGSVG